MPAAETLTDALIRTFNATPIPASETTRTGRRIISSVILDLGVGKQRFQYVVTTVERANAQAKSHQNSR